MSDLKVPFRQIAQNQCMLNNTEIQQGGKTL